MVHPEELAALDLLIWLRTGLQAGRRLGCNQSTISRRVETCRQSFGLRLGRRGGEWHLHGNTLLLEMERTIHQLHRFQSGEHLRLEASPWLGLLLATPPPPPWINGTFDDLGVPRPLQLLRDRVIDAWFCDCRQELPDPGDPEWAIIELGHLPLLLMADRNHPLVGEKGLLAQDLDSFPSLALPEGLYPRTQDLLLAQGLWQDPVPFLRYAQKSWEARTADRLTLSYGNDFARALRPNPVRLDRDLGCLCQVALVARGDLGGHGVLRDLATTLRHRLNQLLAAQPSLELVTMA
jgi:DNA-binding transcriptional LysR family regulator